MSPVAAERVIYDLALAKQICEKLRSGQRKCLDDLIIDYNGLFLNFGRRRLFNPGNLEDVVQSFWEELLNAKAICAYAQGSENKATLRTYLLGVLHHRIIDANRKIKKNRDIYQEGKELSDEADQSPTPQNGLMSSVSQIIARKLVNEALLKLSEDFPLDASLVKMHLEGLDYKQMAEKLGKRIDAIKKQFTREPTGSLAKFKGALKYLMQDLGLRYEDI